MKPSDLKKYYCTWTRAMRELDFSPNLYQNWLISGRIPLHSQLKIEDKTKGLFKADRSEKNKYEIARRRRSDVINKSEK